MTEKAKLLNIIQRCKNYDSQSQFELYNMTYNKALAVVIRYVANKQDAEDIMSEAYYKLFKNIKRYNEQKDFFNWFYTILINTAIDYIRKYKKINVDENEINDIDLISNHNGAKNLDYFKYLEAIHKLSPGYRMVFNLYVIDGYKHREIAEILGISEGTSKSNLVKAKRKLKKYLLI